MEMLVQFTFTLKCEERVGDAFWAKFDERFQKDDLSIEDDWYNCENGQQYFDTSLVTMTTVKAHILQKEIVEFIHSSEGVEYVRG